MTKIPEWAKKFVDFMEERWGDTRYLPMWHYTEEEWKAVEHFVFVNYFSYSFNKEKGGDIATKYYADYLKEPSLELQQSILLLHSENNWQCMPRYLEHFFAMDHEHTTQYYASVCFMYFTYYTINKYREFDSEISIDIGNQENELFRWLHENCQGKWNTNSGTICFEYETDAMLCKLIFMKEQT